MGSHFSIFYTKPHSERTRSAIFNKSCRSDSPLRIRVESAGLSDKLLENEKLTHEQDDLQEEFKFSQLVENTFMAVCVSANYKYFQMCV